MDLLSFNKPIGALILILEIFLFSLSNSAFALISPPVSTKESPYIVVIDPGHGGADSGASGLIKVANSKQKQKTGEKVLEKDITLGIAIRLQRTLTDAKYWRPLGRKIKVILTRDKDLDLSLAQRTEIAQRYKPDLFLSIHANSEPTGKVSGIETFFLNNTDGKSTKKLAQIEEKGAHKLSGEHDASLVLRSIASDSSVALSREAAEVIHKSTLNYLHDHDIPKGNRGIKQSLLYVLLDAQVPSVLFESLFMSNQNDLRFLSDGENRQRLAEGLATGVLRFLATK